MVVPLLLTQLTLRWLAPSGAGGAIPVLVVQKFSLELGHEVGLFVPASLIGVALVEGGNTEVRVQADMALSEMPNLAFQMLTFMTLGPLGQTTGANRDWAIRTLHPAGMTFSV